MLADDADKNMVPWLDRAWCGCGDPTTALDPTNEGIVIDPTQPLVAGSGTQSVSVVANAGATSVTIGVARN